MSISSSVLSMVSIGFVLLLVAMTQIAESGVCDDSSNYGSRKALYRYYKGGSAYDHFYTTSTSEGNAAKTNGYSYEGITGYLWNNEISGVTVPLYRYYNSNIYNHFYTTNPSEVSSYSSYKYEGIIGYVMTQKCNTFNKALYRYYSSSATDHLYTSTWNELGSGAYGYSYEGIQGYVSKS